MRMRRAGMGSFERHLKELTVETTNNITKDAFC